MLLARITRHTSETTLTLARITTKGKKQEFLMVPCDVSIQQKQSQKEMADKNHGRPQAAADAGVLR